LGYDDVVDRTSNAYRYGSYAGQAFNIALSVATPTGWAAVAVRGLNFAATVSGSIDAAEQAMNGNWSAAFLIGLPRPASCRKLPPAGCRTGACCGRRW
jgi:hypothetical protein